MAEPWFSIQKAVGLIAAASTSFEALRLKGEAYALLAEGPKFISCQFKGTQVAGVVQGLPLPVRVNNAELGGSMA